MANTITIEQMAIAGFRAYLEGQTFKLREGKTAKSLAVYAPNAKGKSSLVDAIDFYLSADGTLERFGLRRAGTYAGPEALEHVKARAKGLQPQVTMRFREDNESFGDTRELPNQGMSVRTAAAIRVCKTRKIDFIIRGYQLRRFVEERTSQQRYTDVSGWFSLSPLLDIQNNLRALRLRLKRALDEDAAMNERLKDLQNITDKAFTKWDETGVLAWLNNEHIQKLDGKLTLPALGNKTPVYQSLKERKDQEEQQIGLSAVRAAASSVRSLYEKAAAEEGAQAMATGALVRMETAQSTLVTAKETEEKEKTAAEKAVFKDVWEAADKLFEQQPDIEECPVCRTSFVEMPGEQREQIAPRIKGELAGLQAYRSAVAALRSAQHNVEQTLSAARNQLDTCVTLLGAAGYGEQHPAVVEIAKYKEGVAAAETAKRLPDSTALKERLAATLQTLTEDQKRIEATQEKHTYGKILGKVDGLIALKEKIVHLQKKKTELQKLYDALVSTETFIASQLRGHLQKVLDQLKDRMNHFYESIQPEPGHAPAIRLELDEDAKQPQLHLLVDFAPNREGVMPSGYLSDSQLHTLALSLRLAALEMANKEVPIVVLDDVVTSYDADHRKAIAALLAQDFQSFQVIIATHDEQFFRYLQDHLPAASWHFKRITALEDDFGPLFHDHKVTSEMIQNKWKSGNSAANEIRQAEEEWLLAKAREFGVSVRIRDVHSAYQYDRGELARALHTFLAETKVPLPKVTGIANPFLQSLQKGDVENFGSHFSDNPNAWASIGDEKKRWAEFTEFCGYFVCQACGGQKFKRPKIGMTRAVCNRCETPFAFGGSE